MNRIWKSIRQYLEGVKRGDRKLSRDGMLIVFLGGILLYVICLPVNNNNSYFNKKQTQSIAEQDENTSNSEMDEIQYCRKLEEELEQVRKVRSVQRERRMKNSVPVVAIVGYTNAGKSTLLNQLTGAGIPANNRLFDTLDTASRLLTVSDNLDVILSDTVGFIAKLPHHLVDAFRATLEELEFADLLLHVIDASDPHLEEHIAVVDRLISQLAKPETPVLKCYNKADLVYSDDIPVGKNIVAISAKRGINMDGLLKAIESALNHARHHIVVRLPYAMGGMVETLHDGAQVKKVDYTPEGIEIEAVVDGILYGRLREYIIGEC